MMAKKKEEKVELVIQNEPKDEVKVEQVKTEFTLLNENIFKEEFEKLVRDRYSGQRDLAYIKMTNLLRGIYNE
jgi:hypothetical protein